MQISVVIPTFNRWPLVARAVESVIEQTQSADQIFVVDDGSTDNTASNVKKRFGRYIELLVQANQGVSSARNTAISQADGNWIALLDSDDEWLPQKLEKQLHAATTTDNAVMVHSDEIWIRNGIRVNAARKHRKRGGFIYAHCLPLCCISPSAALINKQVVRDLGGFDENLPACEDYDLWLRLCAKYPVIYIDEPLLRKYGGHQDQLSSKFWGMDRFRIVALEKILASADLTGAQRQITTETLLHKAQIMRKGAIKHNNVSMIEHCNTIIDVYGPRIGSNSQPERQG